MFTRQKLGHGVGLRTRHYTQFLEETPAVSWVEAISENFMDLGGRPLAVLEKVRRDRPVVLHGVSLNIGSATELDKKYLTSLKALVTRIEPAMVSDHVCWGRRGPHYSHDLLPLPYTEEALALTAERIKRVQDFLGRQLLVENVSSYLTYTSSEMPEWEFLSQLAERADCGLLFDINNVYVSSRNHGFDAIAFLDGIPVDRVGQFHLAGHQDRGDIVIDTHEGHVSDPVWKLYEHAVKRFGDVPTLIEWDEGVPELDVLLAESKKAQVVEHAVLGERALQAPHPRPGVAVEIRPEPLRQLQNVMFDFIATPAKIETATAEKLVNAGPLTATARIEVYAEMYWLRMRDTLNEDFKLTRSLMGDEAFEVLIAQYIQKFPSTHYSLGNLGRYFVQFMYNNSFNGRADLADLAALEWARSQSFIAADADVATFAQIGVVAQAHFAEARLTVAPSVKVLDLNHDITDLWKAMQVEGAIPPGVTGRAKTHLVVWRREHSVFHSVISADEFHALTLAIDGALLPALCECFVSADDPVQAAFQAIGSWVNEGMISGIDGPPV